MLRIFIPLFVILIGVVVPGGVRAQSVTGESTTGDYAQAWRLATASLGAAASMPVTASDPATRLDAIERFADYHATLNDAVIALVRMRPPADPTLMRRHFALLPLFQEVTAACAAWLKGLRGADEVEARLAEEWFREVETRLRERARDLEK